MSLRSIGRLLRLSLAPSAAADVAAGMVFGARGRFPSGAGPWLLIAAALGIYTGALALNDWADREHDGRTRPDRPIPSGAVSPTLALALGGVLLAGGVGCAFAAGHTAGGPGGSWLGPWMLVVALSAGLYDLALRGPYLGPLALGLCRAGNLGAGLLLGASALSDSSSQALWSPGLWLPALAYGLYVFLASRLGRMEDGEDALDGARVRRLVLSCGALLLSVPALAQLPLPGLPGPGLPFELPLALAGVWGLAGAARRTEWSLPEVQRTMGLLLRRLLIFSAVLSLAALRFERADQLPIAPLAVAAVILAGYPLAHQLRRVFPPS